ncbi:internalin_A [Hexamita inflata]|uniref:Internalin A n=1 Tax=Hexamita inflata TaxID=28002 RepID=A0AA86TSB8_9EUKA|nr:internalin A [Hexamita inflata]
MQSDSQLPLFPDNRNSIKDKDVVNNIVAPEMILEYDNTMYKRYQKYIQNGQLIFSNSPDLVSLDFIHLLNINSIEFRTCQNMIPKLNSQKIKQLIIIDCQIQSINNFQLDKLEVLKLQNYSQKESKTLIMEITKFQNLKFLYLCGWIVDIYPLSQMISLTKLDLFLCDIRSTEALRPLVNLQDLYLNGNKEIDITTLQYLTKLTKISLDQCCLVNLDALRPLTKLDYLSIEKNSIVYLQAVLELKQLTSLDAQYNKIVDINSIEKHPNFKKFFLVDQEQPTKEQLKEANVMRDVNNQIVSLRNLCKQLNRFKIRSSVFIQQITYKLQMQYINQSSFIAQVTSYFQNMNAFEDYK